jgi:hypothetical protein
MSMGETDEPPKSRKVPHARQPRNGTTHEESHATLFWFVIGAWLSLVEHLVRDQGVGGSNPLAPIN